MVTLSFTIFSGQKNYNRAHMLFQVLCGFEPIFYTTHPNEESNFSISKQVCIFGYKKVPLPMSLYLFQKIAQVCKDVTYLFKERYYL